MRKPDFFIVGAPKSGTTAMYSYLKQHPEIFMCYPKEPHFFGRDLFCPYFIRDEKEYLSLFSGAREKKRAGEASVLYLCSKGAATEIKEFCPAASIIIMLRNPVDVIHSMHSQLVYNGTEDIVDFEAALEAEGDRKRGLRLPDRSDPLQAFFYRELAKYTDQVRRYIAVFGKENVQIIIFDEFTSKTAQAYRKTCEFLDVDPRFAPKFKVVNSSKIVRSKTLRNLLKHPESPTIRKIGRALTPRTLRWTLVKVLMRLNTRYESRQTMDPEVRRRLQTEFRPEVEQLSKLLDRDLSHWCYSNLCS